MNRTHLYLLIILCFSIVVNAQEVTLKTPTGDLYGTLLQPEYNPQKILVIIHQGSGPTDRDGNQAMMKNNSLKMLAEELANNNIATLRYDKRGIAASSAAAMQEKDMRFDDLVEDLRAWITKMDSSYNFEKIIVAGHSEGSLIGMLACINNPAVDKYISIAGIGRSADEVLLTQLAAQGPGVEEMVKPYLQSLKNGDTISNVPASLATLFRPSVQPYIISWFKYNPAKEIAKLSIPVLIIQGNTDIQVSVSEAEILHDAAKESQFVVIKNMNHVLKTCKSKELKDQMTNYANPELPLSKKFRKTMTRFILD